MSGKSTWSRFLPKQKALFIHIQKTAGSSLVRMAQGLYGLDQFSSHGDFHGVPVGELAGREFLSGHFGYAYAESEMAKRYSFTFMRDPVARLISLYNFCRGDSETRYPIYRAAKAMSFEDFIAYGSEKGPHGDIDRRMVHECIWNNQVWQLAHGWTDDLWAPSRISVSDFGEAELLDLARMNLDRLDHVGMVETFEDDLVIITQALGFSSAPTRLHVNESPLLVQREKLSVTTLACIREATMLDQALYAYAQEKRLSVLSSGSSIWPLSLIKRMR